MRIFGFLILLIIFACSGLQTKKIDETQISEQVRVVLDASRDFIRQNKLKESMAQLASLSDQKLTPVEKALKYNLKGVTLFNMGEVEKSILNFEIADKYTPKETQLYSQVQLNMASGYFKLNQYNDLRNRLENIDLKVLSESELKKYAQLELAYGNKFKDNYLITLSSLRLLEDAKTYSEVQNSNLYEPMKQAFRALAPGERVKVLEKVNQENNIAVAHLAQLEAEDRYMAGDKSGAKDLVSWLRSNFDEYEEVRNFVKEFDLRLENSYRIEAQHIGIVLPLTGERSSFGQRALNGIDTGMKIMEMGDKIKIFPKDTADSPARAAQAVVDLIREERVAFIIGGLFPESAKAEYLEARKYGVLYISLSQINLPKEEKNLHLIEIQGSIESQVETLLSDEMINKFGTRVGVIYPDTEGGKAYLDEVWRRANQKKLKVSTVAAFPRNAHDYRNTAQLFLGLKYPREREEELKILEDVYAEERTSIRRVQVLPPVIDFDWVFVASYPHEAVQLISTLAYYDANRIKVIGGPSWATRSMVKEQKNLGTLYFVGDDPKDINQEVLTKFQEIYGKPASLIEILALEGMKIGSEMLSLSGDVSSREEFDNKIRSKGSLAGLASSWKVEDGIWLKQMSSLTITGGEIVKLFPQQDLN